jgi:hypothetical protein
MANILPVAPPRLPTATNTYERQYQDQLLDILRLYFNRLGGNLNTLVGANGGKYINNPYGAFSSQVVQSVAAINTPTRVSFSNTDYANNVYYTAGDGFHVGQDGVYNIQFSAQLTNADVQAHDAAIWLRQGAGTGAAVDVPYTNSVTTVPSVHGGQPGHHVIAANFFVQLAANDFVEFWWSTNSTQVTLDALPAITTPFVAPGAPSIVATVTFVSNL